MAGKTKTVRMNRALLVRALPHALWNAAENARVGTRITQASCLSCKAGAFCAVHEIYWPIRDDISGQYLAIALNDADKVSYAANPDDRNDEVQRMKTSFARYVRRQLNISSDRLADDKLAAMQARLISVTKSDYEADVLEVRRGKQLQRAYLNAVGKESCMTGRDRQPLTALYAANPDQVGLAVFAPNGREYRALLWETEDGRKYLDRIYPADGHADYYAFLRWADLNKIHRYDDSKVPNILTVVLPNGVHEKYPFLDSMWKMQWVDGVPGGLRLRIGKTLPTAKEERDHWPLYIKENTLRDRNNEPVPCRGCSKAFPKEQLLEKPDGQYCPGCVAKLTRKCCECGVEAWGGTMPSIVSGDAKKPRIDICDGCFKAAALCTYCGEHWVAKYVNSDGHCRECAPYAKAETR